MADILDDVARFVLEGNVRGVSESIGIALEEGVDAQSILRDGLLKGLGVLGERFKNSEVFIAELLQASKAFNVGSALLKDQLASKDSLLQGKVIIATVEGDLHDIGKNLVKYVLEDSGFEVIDLGIDISPSEIVEATREHEPDIVALSAMLTTTMLKQKETIEALEQAGLRNKVKVMIGGTPTSDTFARRIGADGYSDDASKAADVAEGLVRA